MNEAVKIYESLPKKDEWPENINEFLKCEFNIVPEIAAGATGYAYSDKRRNGLHIMIDVGSGTVDVCMFILGSNDAFNRYSLLEPVVKPLGTAMYHRHMLGLFNKHSHADSKFTHRALQKPIVDIRDFMAFYNLQGHNNINESQFMTHKLKFESKVEDVLKRSIWKTKNKRDPNSPTWKNNRSLPLIMIGGGSKSVVYLNSITRINNWMKDEVGNRGFTEILSVELPELIKDVKPEYLTVAWGLSHRALDIGQIIPADRIKDIDPLPVAERIYRNDDD